MSAAEHVVDDKDSDEDLRLLLAPGSSLRGARPKASVRDRDGHLAIAKFPNKGDEVNTVLWEVGKAVATWRKAAAKIGLTAPEIERMASAFEHEDLKTPMGAAGRLS